jgi:L-methionine (R)-S-oxide reductase
MSENDLRIIDNLLDGSDTASSLQRLVEYLRETHSNYSWVGVYLLEGDTLVLRAWSGKRATEHVRIPIGRGLCGLAARTKMTVIVGDVQSNPDYLACFLETKSEIVVPIIDSRGMVLGEIDIDGEESNAYGEADKTFLESVAGRLARLLAG